MDLSVFQRTIVNEEGATLPAAQIDVFLAGTATRPDLFSDAAGTTPITNPFNADVNGFAQFYVEFGNYDVTANLGGSTATWDDVLIGRTPLAYNDDTASYIDNTLVSGAIIEKGSNANGRYLKYADGTLVYIIDDITMLFSSVDRLNTTVTFPIANVGVDSFSGGFSIGSADRTDIDITKVNSVAKGGTILTTSHVFYVYCSDASFIATSVLRNITMTIYARWK